MSLRCEHFYPICDGNEQIVSDGNEQIVSDGNEQIVSDALLKAVRCSAALFVNASSQYSPFSQFVIVTFRGDEIARARGASLSGDSQKHEDRFVDFNLCMHVCACLSVRG